MLANILGAAGVIGITACIITLFIVAASHEEWKPWQRIMILVLALVIMAVGLGMLASCADNEPPCVKHSTIIIKGVPYQVCDERAEPVER